jgi:mRNA interferase MazF
MKDFDTWNEEKKIVNERRIDENLFFYDREVWWCSVGINVGIEADGKNSNFERPILVLKKFNSNI